MLVWILINYIIINIVSAVCYNPYQCVQDVEIFDPFKLNTFSVGNPCEEISTRDYKFRLKERKLIPLMGDIWDIIYIIKEDENIKGKKNIIGNYIYATEKFRSGYFSEEVKDIISKIRNRAICNINKCNNLTEFL